MSNETTQNEDQNESRDDLKRKIKQCGGLQFTVDETALLCEIDGDAIRKDADLTSEYLTGRLQSQHMARTMILREVRDGNLPACRQLLQLASGSEPDVSWE